MDQLPESKHLADDLSIRRSGDGAGKRLSIREKL